MAISTNHYGYTHITSKPRTFRLIKLLPPQKPRLPLLGLLRSTVRIEIVEVDIDDTFPYDALSYSWDVSGMSPPDRPVIVETAEGPRCLYIFEPLETALLHLSFNKSIQLPLFVDQICINQIDHEEKVVQVQLMRDIYTNCVRTVVWLGPGSRATDSYLDFTRTINESAVIGRLMGPHVSHLPAVFDAVMDPGQPVTGVELEDRDDVLFLLSQCGSDFPIIGLEDLLRRTWFTRLWIIQEVCLAPAVTFVCGTRLVCFDCLRAGSLFYSIYNTHWVKNVKHSITRKELRQRDNVYSLTRSFIRIFQERKAIHATRQRQGLYELVLKYNVNDGQPKIGASLPEDRVFGVLGLASDLWPFDEAMVQYGETAKVYTEFAGSFAKRSIDFLLFSQYPKLVKGLPSWVPDWSMNLKIPRGYETLIQPIYKAGGTLHGDGPWVNTNSERLCVQGLIVGRIVEIGTHTIQKDDDGAVLDQICYRSLKRFFDETEGFLDRVNPGEQLGSSPLEGTQKALAAMRLSDFGLSEKHFSETLDAQAAKALMQALYAQAYKWGKRLIDTDLLTQSFGITRIYKTLGIVPWYGLPASEVEVLYLCASKPSVACQRFLQGVRDFSLDLIGLVAASVRVQINARFIRMRRHLSRVSFQNQDRAAVLKRVDLDPELSGTAQMNTYTEYVYRGIGQRLYRTTQGHVGLVPRQARSGDLIVVFFGGSTPHVVREKRSDAVEYAYLGEAYCDGVMEGELLVSGKVREETFQLV